MQKRLQIKIQGQVQGVNFRCYVVQKARQLGLVGYVRNLKSGAVQVVAEGEEAGLQEFLGWCRQGPPAARVNKVRVEWDRVKGEFDRFEIRH